MSSMKTSSANLAAFLLWNALVNGTTRRAREISVTAVRWVATRERYMVMVLTGFAPGDMGFPRTRLKNALIGDILGIVIIIVFASSLVATVANSTTGITIAHAGFVPSLNITSSLGVVPILQLVPFIFVALIIFAALAVLEKHTPSGL